MENLEKPKRVMSQTAQIERSIIKKYRKQIWGNFVQAIQEFEMVEENDKIAVCISGGKDSGVVAALTTF